MGRWGYRIFEGDNDIDVACAIKCPYGTGKDNDLHLVRMVNQTDMMAPPEVREFYKTSEYREELDAIIMSTREKLDTGLGDQLFTTYRALEHEDQGKYRVIIVGALMMRAGARIRQADLDHLRELAEGFAGRHGYVSPIAEDGFRHVGKVQFLAALDHYEAGTPRDFGEPSCFQCGKIKADIGQAPKKCGKCGRAWFCNVECQKAAWKNHRPVCKTLEQCRFVNV
ncbi:hypothetical protein CGCSCA5_v000309 [Colletotrichum siamense]|nr:hypothetical protein CGCSCA5_v000309 [Colletotrichum siamense]